MFVALITGGGTGIGAAAARRLSADGWRVAVSGRRSDPLDGVAEEIGGLAIQGDQSNEADCQRVVAETLARFGRIDALVVSGGIDAFGAFDELEIEQWHQVMRVNVDGTLLMARAAAPALRESRGAIVVVSSVAGVTSGPRYAAYVTSKTAVIGLVRSMAVDLGVDGVRVNALCPGWVSTEMSRREVAELATAMGTTTAEAADLLLEHLPLGRMAEPDEIAGSIAFLVGPDSKFMTGSTVVVDGGGAVTDVATLAFRHLKI